MALAAMYIAIRKWYNGAHMIILLSLLLYQYIQTNNNDNKDNADNTNQITETRREEEQRLSIMQL